MSTTTVAVVTCWTDHLELADDYFEAVLPELEPGDESIIVDNASDPPLAFAHLFPRRNLGFARGSNLGLKHASADAIVFLNNDVALTRRGWLEEIRQALEPGVLVGPLRNHAGASVNGHSMPYIDGWLLAGMRQDLLDLSGFDETLVEPAYFSDNILCLEARAAGMTLRDIVPGLQHKLNQTAGPAANADVRAATLVNRERYLARARELLTPA